MGWNFASFANDVWQVGIVVEAFKEFASHAYGIHRHEVACMAIGGPTYACDFVENIVGGLHKRTERGKIGRAHV